MGLLEGEMELQLVQEDEEARGGGERQAIDSDLFSRAY